MGVLSSERNEELGANSSIRFRAKESNPGAERRNPKQKAERYIKKRIRVITPLRVVDDDSIDDCRERIVKNGFQRTNWW